MKVNKTDLAFILNCTPANAKGYFERYCIMHNIKYFARMELDIADLSKFLKLDIPAKVDFVRDNILRFRDSRIKILNDKKGVNSGKIPATLSKILTHDQLEFIKQNWSIKREQLKNQLQIN